MCQVMYFSSIFPYVVLICFLIRGLLLDGALEGIAYMFYPKVHRDKIFCRVSMRDVIISLTRLFLSALLITVGNLGKCAGVATGSHAGFLCTGPRFWVRHRLLLLQSQEQQLPP